MATTADQVVAAVRVLYGPSHNLEQQAAANQWLTAFQHSAEAWRVPFDLLAPHQPGEVQFFGATLLVRKVRSEWTKLDAGGRQGLSAAIRAKFQEVLGWQASGQPPASELVLRQLCALLAAVAGASGGAGANELTSQALGLLRGGDHSGQHSVHPSTPLALRLLTALAQEAEDLDRVRRQALVNVLLPRAREVLGALGALLGAAAGAAAAGDRGPEAAAVAALQCAESWLELNPVAGSGCIFTPAELHQQQPQLFASLLALLTAGRCGEEVVEAAAGVLLLVFGPENFSSDENADLAASSALSRALLATREQLAGVESEALPAAVAKLASALAERSPEFCCGQMAEAVALSELVLECLSRPGPDMASHTVDYFLMANTVSLAQRPPALRAPLYEAVLQRLVPHASYPPDFSSWQEEFELDEDAFVRLRDQFLPELLDVSYGLLRMRYLTLAWQQLQGAASWQAAEAALYLLSAVSLAVKARVLSDTPAGSAGDENSGGGGGGAAAAAAVAEDRQQTQALLGALFGQICSPEGASNMLGAHPALAEAACKLLEHYSSWFGRAAEAEGAPLQGAFQLLLSALRVPQASHAAARAFQQLCLRCSWKVRDAASFGWLIDTAHVALQQTGGTLPIGERQLIVEGLARVAAAQQPGQPLLEAAARLTGPFVQQATTAVAAATAANGAGPDGASRRCLADSLRLLAAALRYLAPAGDDRGEVGMQPAAAVLAQAEPTLRAVAETPAWQADRDAVAAVAEVYLRAVGTAKQHGLQLAMSALPAMSTLFAATALPGCLDVVVEALEMQCEQPAAAGAAMHALASACDTAMPLLQGAGLREQPALVSSLLSLAYTCATHAPAQLWSGPALPLLVQLACAAARLRETDPVSHSLEFLSKLVATYVPGEEEGVTEAHLHAVHGVLAAQGEPLVASLLAALCDSCPRHLMRSTADVVRKLCGHPQLGTAAASWLAAAAASGQLPGVADGYLTAEDCATFASLAASLAGMRFNALLVDFGLLARGHNTSDVLLAYEF